MDYKKLIDDFNDFCASNECEACKYGELSMGECQLAYAYDEGCKRTFNAAVDLLSAFKTGGNDSGHNQR